MNGNVVYMDSLTEICTKAIIRNNFTFLEFGHIARWAEVKIIHNSKSKQGLITSLGRQSQTNSDQFMSVPVQILQANRSSLASSRLFWNSSMSKEPSENEWVGESWNH